MRHSNQLNVLNFAAETLTYIYIFVIPPHWQTKDSLNSSSYKTRTHIFYIVTIMVADVLAMQGARASATMILT